MTYSENFPELLNTHAIFQENPPVVAQLWPVENAGAVGQFRINFPYIQN